MTDVDLFGLDLAQAPFEVYRRLRDTAPAVFVPEHDFWVVTRYDDVRAAGLAHDRFSSAFDGDNEQAS
jgi:cytochrome P450